VFLIFNVFFALNKIKTRRTPVVLFFKREQKNKNKKINKNVISVKIQGAVEEIVVGE
jgi:hypothetical protein